MPPRHRVAWAKIRAFFDAGNLFRAVVAVILAFSLWAWVTSESDPEITRTISQVQVTTRNAPSGLEVVGQVPTVEVRLQGARSRIQPIETGNVAAYIDLKDVKQPGTVTVPVEVETPSEVRVVAIEPKQVQVTLDRIVSRDGIRVETTQPRNLPPNFEVRSISANPQQVKINGPQASVDQVVAVRADVSIDGRSAGYTDSVAPTPIDARGTPIPNVTVDPPRIEVSVDLEVRGQVRKVIPEVVGTDALAPGYELVRPPTVVPSDEIVVDGPSDQVANVLYLTTEPIDITGWNASDVVRDVPLDLTELPPDVTVENTTVHVSIQIRKQSFRQQISNVPIQLVNVRPGTTATASPTVATVTLEGSRSVVEGLMVSDVSVVVDLSSAGPGTYQLRPRVILPATVQFREVDPQRVTVTVTESPPPASAPTPAPAPTPTPSP